MKLEQWDTFVDRRVQAQGADHRMDSTHAPIGGRLRALGHLVGHVRVSKHRVCSIRIGLALETFFQTSAFFGQDFLVSFLHLKGAPFGLRGFSKSTLYPGMEHLSGVFRLETKKARWFKA